MKLRVGGDRNEREKLDALLAELGNFSGRLFAGSRSRGTPFQPQRTRERGFPNGQRRRAAPRSRGKESALQDQPRRRVSAFFPAFPRIESKNDCATRRIYLP